MSSGSHAQPKPATQASSTAIPNGTNIPSGPQQTSSPTNPASTSSKYQVDVDSALVTRLQSFVEAFYYVLPNDQPTDRAKRMPSFVHTNLDLTITFQAAEDKVRLAKQLDQHAFLVTDPNTMTAFRNPKDPTQVSVTAQVLVNLYYHGTMYPYVEQPAQEPITTVWSKNKSGGWYLIRFIEGGDSG